MKALSIWQPWAFLIAAGMKHYETRSWQTKYRGPLLICASKKLPDYDFTKRLFFDNGLCTAGVTWFDQTIGPTIIGQLGKAACIVDHTDCILLSRGTRLVFEHHSPQEFALGDYSVGRFAWELGNVRRFVEPWRIKGHQGLFNVPDEEIARHEIGVAS